MSSAEPATKISAAVTRDNSAVWLGSALHAISRMGSFQPMVRSSSVAHAPQAIARELPIADRWHDLISGKVMAGGHCGHASRGMSRREQRLIRD
jgi:hypothetical protein